MSETEGEARPGPRLGLRELYDGALAQHAGTRDSWLDNACPDPALRARVQKLLDANDDSFDPIALSARERLELLDNAFADQGSNASALIGRRFGAFTLLRPIGQGGMATVFLAERREGEFVQRAAVKLMRRTILGDLERRAFARERKLLGALEDPRIARLIDGGVSDNDEPFLVMEYVQGSPITEFANRQALSLGARVDLMIEVCEAVAAAQAQLIVHRDLKPSNVLVTEAGEVRLLDFGVAKLLGDDGELTRDGFVGFTAAYAAPEQLVNGPISTATDVFALGVICHELLVGGRPPGDALLAASQLVLRAGADRPTITARTAHRFLRGDLDNILRKALEPDPARRYPSAAALSADLARFQQQQPVDAHPPSNWYRARKFVQRHRGSVGLTLALLLAVLASLSLALWQGAEARHQAELARQEAARAQAETVRANRFFREANRALAVASTVQEFLVGLFEAAVPAGPREQQPTLLDIVNGAEARVRDETEEAPEVRHELLFKLIQMREALGDTSSAIALAQDSLDLAEQAFGADSLQAQGSRFELLRMQYQQGEQSKLGELEKLLAQARVQRPHALETASQMLFLGEFLGGAGRGEEGIAMIEAAIVPLTAACKPDATEACRLLATATNNLGSAQYNLRLTDAARTSLARAVEQARAAYGPQHRLTGRYLGNLALMETFAGQRTLALAHIKEAMRISQRSETERAAVVPSQRVTLSLLLNASGRMLDSATEFAANIDAATPDMQKDRTFPMLRINYAKALLAIGEYAGARAEVDRVRPNWEAAPESNLNGLARMHEVLAVIAAESSGDHAGAAREIDRALALRRQQKPLLANDQVSTLAIGHRVALNAGNTKRASRLLREGEEILAGGGEPSINTRLFWMTRRFADALAHGDLAAARAQIDAYTTELDSERPSLRYDILQSLRLQLAAADPSFAHELDRAWLADFEKRVGPRAPALLEVRRALAAIEAP